MILPGLALLSALSFATGTGPGDPQSYSGRERQISAHIPRLEMDVVIDGELNEPAWQQAARLHGFSQYAPTDGLPASDSTEVRVWYSPTAIYFGVRAYEAHGTATATLADRDRIFSDDNVQILLGTFHDGRQALMFAVNPLGVQGDGALTEGRNTGGGGFIGSAVAGREQADLSPDFVFQSRGHLTPWGYEVEIRIPFKSLRYQPAREQNWNLNIIRDVKHSGFEDTWAPVLRASPSFLNQSGEIVGLTDLHRGLVMDLNPEVTQRAVGALDTAGRFNRDAGRIQIGGNVRWGISNGLTLNGTAHPDFSQVESDAGQLAFDPRQALFFPEKRPFFLEGNELFAVPNNLVYTRRIVQPVAAAKLTGNVHGTNIGFISAVDDQAYSATGNNPVFNILRLQRNLGARSRIGMLYTDEMDGGNYNRVGSLDGRFNFGGIYAFTYQVAGSMDRRGGITRTAPLFAESFNIRGHHFGLGSSFGGISDRFRTTSGFIGRAGIVHAFVDPSWTVYGQRGALLERFTGDIVLDGTWQYQRFFNSGDMQDKKLHFNANAALRGGWNVGVGYFIESFGYDPGLFANYLIEVPKTGGGLDTIPFVGQPRIPNGEYIVQFSTPQWRHFSANAFWLQGHDENYPEWASGNLIYAQGALAWRPTDRLRTEVSYFWQQVDRRTDGSTVLVGRIPRVKMEYQVSRPFFVRLVAQYVQDETDSLRDDSRTNGPILFQTPSGVVRSTAVKNEQFHADVLLSYQPTPGTTILAGYGSNALDDRAFGFRNLTRTDDAFFLKISYLFRL